MKFRKGSSSVPFYDSGFSEAQAKYSSEEYKELREWVREKAPKCGKCGLRHRIWEGDVVIPREDMIGSPARFEPRVVFARKTTWTDCGSISWTCLNCGKLENEIYIEHGAKLFFGSAITILTIILVLMIILFIFG